VTKQELRQQWSERIVEYKASGQNQTTWRKENNISLRQLSYWLKKEKSETGASEPSPQGMSLKLNQQEESPGNNALHIKVGPATIEVKPGFNQTLLLDVLKVLRVLC